MNLTPEIIDDAAKFSRFAQWFKMEIWKKSKDMKGYFRVPSEKDLDEIASKVWEKLR